MLYDLHMYVANLEAVQSQDHAGNTSKSHPFLLRFFFYCFLVGSGGGYTR